jgi:hypothetical protein
MRALAVYISVIGSFGFVWSVIVENTQIAYISAGVMSVAIGGKYFQKRLEEKRGEINEDLG